MNYKASFKYQRTGRRRHKTLSGTQQQWKENTENTAKHLRAKPSREAIKNRIEYICHEPSEIKKLSLRDSVDRPRIASDQLFKKN